MLLLCHRRDSSLARSSVRSTSGLPQSFSERKCFMSTTSLARLDPIVSLLTFPGRSLESWAHGGSFQGPTAGAAAALGLHAAERSVRERRRQANGRRAAQRRAA